MSILGGVPRSEPDRDPLESVIRELRASGIPVTVLRRDPDLAVQIGDDENATMAVAIHDPKRPSFAVSYPALRVKRSGDRRIETIHVSGVLLPALLWIAQQLAEHSAVRPEHE